MVDTEILWQQLKTVLDPDVHVNVVDLGLIYSILPSENCIKIVMTLTSPSCPMGDFLISEVKNKVESIYGNIFEINVELTWDPPWNENMITEIGRMELGLL